MGKLVVSSFMTLDGVGQDPTGWDSTPIGGWSLPYIDRELADAAQRQAQASDVFLCGRVTYEGFAAHGPSLSGPYADALNRLPKLVPSRALSEPLGWNAMILKGDLVEEVRRLKVATRRDILTYGGPSLIRSLMGANLVDEYHIKVFPVILGAGARLFSDGVPSSRLTPFATDTLRSGVTVLSLRRQEA